MMSTRKRIVRHGFPDGKRNSIRKFIPLTLALILGLSTFLPVLGGSGLGAQSVYAADPTTFTIRIENISGDSNLPTPFAPGVWAVHRPITRPLFQTNQPDRGDGLVALAEDGNPGELATSLSTANGVFSSGVFNTPVGSDGPGPLLPGGVYEFQITAEPGDYLSFASMLVQSNDLFVGPGPRGIDLFDGRDRPISGDITDQSPLWDVGSEANEAPGLGPNQAPRQSGPNTGPGEGGVSAFSNTTRSLPLPGHIVDVDIKESDGTFTFTIHNTSTRSGAIDTPIAPVFYATHNANWRLFSNGEPASPGLESLAEDGSPVGLVGEHSGAIGTEMVGAQPITRERPDAEPGPAFPGESYEFSVTPSIAYPNLTIAMMVVQTNDVFLAFGAKGVALLDYAGHPRATEDILADVERELAIWDAGTEMNEVPGVGVHQAPRQAGPNMGAADPVPGVRLYNDSTNDLTGPNAGGFGTITVVNGETAGTFDVTLQNTSDQTVYPGVLTPAVYAIHSGNTQLFEPGMPASSGLERLSEDGNPTALVNESNNNSDVASVGVANTPSGASEPGPLTPGDSYQFSVTADAVNRYFSVASMIVPSNDTFFAFEPEGLRLMNQDGTPRSDAEIAADIATQRLAWDAGTERNQAGAAGPDQAPRQAGPNTGADEGNGKVRLLDDPVWSHPKASDVVRIPIVPTRSMPELPDDEP
ncbi:spondin domain-containing protein, partial [Chloroflexi bacterium TSY]|nr:spondin domain-containing protein [Chloroflexi bacterium TSY]